MKIGIVTFHGTWNCGAVLQCVALKTKLEMMGHSVRVINYRPNYQQVKYKKYPNPFRAALTRFKETNGNFAVRLITGTRAFVRTVLNYSPNSGRMKRKDNYDVFCKKFFDETKLYRSLNELRDNPPDVDAVISGSDQLWNPTLTDNSLDEAYFCNFGSKKMRRISYAVSATQLDVEKYKEQLRRLLSGFDYISLREKEQLDLLKVLTEKDINICVDPTLLLQKDDYLKFEAADIDEDKPYLLVYAFDVVSDRELLYRTVADLKERYELRVKVINGPHRWPYAVDYYEPLDGLSPGEFLWYIKNAEVVVTNSFHATVFSILYNINFYTMTVPGRGARMVELLQNLGIEERIINQESVLTEAKIDFSLVEERLRLLRIKSERYLADALS